ncbi:MAG: DUF4136 domain-containing protein [Nitrospira sp.]|nr:DUF4136 domain-containing protein [Nitrospira sp.]
MSIRFLIVWLALVLLAAGGCAAGPQVITDFDRSVEFSAFRTFAYLGMTDRGYEVGPSDRSPLRGRVKEMVDKQLAAKGFTEVRLEDSPDLLVHIFFGVLDERSVETTSRMPGFFGRQVQAYEYHEGTWTPIKTTRVITHEDHEGTLIVDLADASKKELVWRSVIKAVLGDDLEKNFQMADKGVAEAFKDYPPAK